MNGIPMLRSRNWRPRAIGLASFVVSKWSKAERKEGKEHVKRNYYVVIFCISTACEVGLSDNRVVPLGIPAYLAYSSRRPVLEEPPTRAPQVLRVPIGVPPPPAPGAHAAMPIQMPPQVEPPLPAPGATPTMFVRGPQRVAG